MDEIDEIDAEILTGKTIKEIEVTGYGICLKTTDGLIFDYESSDGGYSCWGIKAEGDEEEGFVKED